MSRPRIKYFKIYTGYAEVADLYRLLDKLAGLWTEREVESVRLFRANATDVYIAIRARRWYSAICSDDPDWGGDAEDVIADSVFKYHYRALRSTPQPQRVWRGEWKDFDTPESLAELAQDKLDHFGKVS